MAFSPRYSQCRVWYGRTPSNTKWVAQEILAKGTNSNAGISSQSQQTKHWREGRKSCAWKLFFRQTTCPLKFTKLFLFLCFLFLPITNDSVENNFCSERFFEISLCEGLKMHAGPWFSILSVHSNHLVNSEKCCCPEPHRLNQNPRLGARGGGSSG